MGFFTRENNEVKALRKELDAALEEANMLFVRSAEIRKEFPAQDEFTRSEKEHARLEEIAKRADDVDNDGKKKLAIRLREIADKLDQEIVAKMKQRQ